MKRRIVLKSDEDEEFDPKMVEQQQMSDTASESGTQILSGFSDQTEDYNTD